MYWCMDGWMLAEIFYEVFVKSSVFPEKNMKKWIIESEKLSRVYISCVSCKDTWTAPNFWCLLSKKIKIWHNWTYFSKGKMYNGNKWLFGIFLKMGIIWASWIWNSNLLNLGLISMKHYIAKWSWYSDI